MRGRRCFGPIGEQDGQKEKGPEKGILTVRDSRRARRNEGPDHDHRPDLAFLEELLLEKSQLCGERGYNELRKGTEERLRLISENRISKHSDKTGV